MVAITAIIISLVVEKIDVFKEEEEVIIAIMSLVVGIFGEEEIITAIMSLVVKKIDTCLWWWKRQT